MDVRRLLYRMVGVGAPQHARVARQRALGREPQRLTVDDGDWTVIDIPLTMTPSGVLEVPLLEFLRARAEVAGYPKLTVRH